MSNGLKQIVKKKHLLKIEDEADFEDEVNIQGIEIKDIKVIERVDDWWILKEQRMILFILLNKLME